MYMNLHSGYPKYFEPFLKPRHNVHRTRRSQSDSVLLEVPYFASIYKSKKYFVYDAPKTLNFLVFLCSASPCNVSDLMIMISDIWHYASYSLSINGD